MKVYKVYYHTVAMGATIEWHRTKGEAEAAFSDALAYREECGEGGCGPEGIEVVDIPTDKAGLIEWLNHNLSTDNG
jgi:hypothetical protein